MNTIDIKEIVALIKKAKRISIGIDNDEELESFQLHFDNNNEEIKTLTRDIVDAVQHFYNRLDSTIL